MSIWRLLGGLLAVFSEIVMGGAALAQAADDSPFAWLGLPAGRVGYSSGMDITGSSQSNYGTLEIALFGASDKDGWRLQLYGAQSTYSYSNERSYCLTAIDETRQGKPTRAPGLPIDSICNSISSHQSPQEERALYAKALAPFGLFINGSDVYYSQTYETIRYDAAITPGYQLSVGAGVIKVWLGPGYEYSHTMPGDPSKSINGAHWGVKSGVNAWMPLGEDAWLAADASYFTASERYSAGLRIGYRPLSWLTAGPQLAAFGDRDDASQRAGGFVSIDALGMETTLSGGWSGNYDATVSPYGTASIYTRF